jgi:hypothetical protein
VIEMDEKVLKKQRLRVRILDDMYDTVDGNTSHVVENRVLAQHFGMGQRELSFETEYLVREGLLGIHGMGVTLTHEGIREVEEMRTRPDESTQHFLALNVLNIGSIVGSQINQGSPFASQTGDSDVSPLRLAELLRNHVSAMRELEPQDRAELLHAVDRLLNLLQATTGSSSRS